MPPTFPISLEVSAQEFQQIAALLRRRNPATAHRLPLIYGYVRVSHYDSAKSGLSPEEQTDAINECRHGVCKKHPELELGPIYRDDGVSALKDLLVQRPQGSKLLAALQPGDHVVFKRLDRGFRRLVDTCTWMTVWNERGITMHFTDIDLDTSSPNGRMVVHMMGAFAEYEGERIAERNRDIAKRRKARTRSGRLASGGRPQIGFKKMGPPGRRHLVDDQEMRAWMGRVVNLRDKLRLSFSEIAEILSGWVLNLAEPGSEQVDWRDRAWTRQSAERWYLRAKELGIEPDNRAVRPSSQPAP